MARSTSCGSTTRSSTSTSSPCTFAGLLSRIDNGLGKVTTIDYATSTSFAARAKYRRDRWRTTLPIVVPVVSKIQVTDSLEKLGLPAHVMTRKYEYRDGYYDGKEHEFRGFADVKITDSGDEAQETQVTHTWMHVGRNLDTGADEEVLKGKVYKQTVESVKGDVYGTVETKWERRWLCQEALELETPALSGRKLLPTCAGLTTDKDAKRAQGQLDGDRRAGGRPAAAPGKRRRDPRYTYEENLYNAWGDVVEHRVHGEVRTLQNSVVGNFGTFQEVLGDERIERTKRIYAVAPWLLGFSGKQRGTRWQWRAGRCAAQSL